MNYFLDLKRNIEIKEMIVKQSQGKEDAIVIGWWLKSPMSPVSTIVNITAKTMVTTTKTFCTLFISKLKNIQTSFSNFMWNTDTPLSYLAVRYIGGNRREMLKKCHGNCLIYSDEKTRVSTTTLCGFYRYNNLGGIWNRQLSNSTRFEHHFPLILKELLWRH